MGRQEKIVKIIEDLNEVKSLLKSDEKEVKYIKSIESAIRQMKSELVKELLKSNSNV